MRKRDRILALCYAALGLCIVISWGVVFGWDVTAAVPLGLCPILVLAGSMSSVLWLALSILGVLLIYIWTSWALWGVSRRRRYGTVSIVVILTLDTAANVVFTITSWWYLLAVALDLMMLALSYKLYRAAGAS